MKNPKLEKENLLMSKVKNRVKKMNFQTQPRTGDYIEITKGDKYMYEFRIRESQQRQKPYEILSRTTGRSLRPSHI